MQKTLPEPKAVTLQAAARNTDAFYAIPDASEVMPDEDYREVVRFKDHLIQYLESFREACRAARPAGFDEDIAEDARRAASKLVLYRDRDTGEIVQDAGDGHCSMGMTHGLSAQAVRSGASLLTHQLLTMHAKPFIIIPKGQRDDAKTMVTLLDAILTDLLGRGKFETRLRSALSIIPKSKAVVFRYMMGAESEVVFSVGEDGVGRYVEKPAMLKPYFSVWPIENVFVANPNENDPELQEGIFYISAVTLLDLQRNEYVYGAEGGGRFVNLERLQQDAESTMRDAATDQGSDRASLFPQMGLVEFEGRLPISRFVRSGLFTPAVARWFNVPPPEDGETPAGLVAWGRRLDRIPVWWVSYVSHRAGSDLNVTGNSVEDHLLQCEPARGMRAHNSMFVFRNYLDGTNFYGMSIPEMCADAERVADFLLNEHTRIISFNANPPKIISTVMLKDLTEAEAAQRLMTPGETLSAKPMMGGQDLESVVRFMKLPEISGILENLSYYRALHEAKTGITAVSKGVQASTDTGTLGEIQIMQSNSALESDERILSDAQELSRLYTRIVEDFFFYRSGDPELVDYLAAISGLPASDIEKALPSIYPISESFKISHPVQVQQDMAVRSTLLMKCLQIFPDAITDKVEALRMVVEAAGMPALAERLVDSQRMLDPEDEHQQMRVGNYVSPKATENFALHLQMHLAEFGRLQAILANPMPGVPDYDEAVLEYTQLPQHIQDTQMIMSAAMMAMQQAQPMNAGGENPFGSQPNFAPEGNRPANAKEEMTNLTNEALGKGGNENESVR